ncbi:ATP-dependent rRNA helicase RRP3 [Suhomyces tanzawaensis NRRL Y-17324]|uniref:ATP-dependent rRNA helicase RRP3 n=1 Tax=Suhomyces tanzawaensis NRRL Y-17324 TaxID=984487 RepID=A0A1E4SNK1_9ASCO|nr:ATP-dependent rRNA helicase RRP3 [Suhomyces tanzawaensis NRRL Y-17324]ODV81101.1 ATP-dependent rRNA helicase RRP3 [Suhomyces tanzawaensis NRRL Y-17324]
MSKVKKPSSVKSSARELAEKIKRNALKERAEKERAEKASKASPEVEEEEVVVDVDGKGESDGQPVTFRTFSELKLIPELMEAIEHMKYTKPTPIQAQSIPHALKGKDIIGLAQTGSGKTAAFAIPILQALWYSQAPYFGLVLAPTRELAYQIKETFDALGSAMGLRSVCVVGGMDIMDQARDLMRKPHVVVATPGRIMDHLEHTKGFSLKNLKYLVMDEADRLLDMDFGPALDKILKIIPRERVTYLFSATMTNKIEKLQRASLKSPVRIAVSTKYQTADNLIQSMMLVLDGYKNTYLVHLLNEYAGKSIIIFTRTCAHSQRTSLLARILGFAAVPLHGQLSQAQRLGLLNKFKAGSSNILVATDVAARGLDIPSVDVVINYDIPTDSKAYIHRVGRTARAGRSGRSISLITQYDLEMYLRIESVLGKKLPKDPSPDKAVLEALHVHVDRASAEAIRQTKDFHDKRGKRRGDDREEK